MTAPASASLLQTQIDCALIHLRLVKSMVLGLADDVNVDAIVSELQIGIDRLGDKWA